MIYLYMDFLIFLHEVVLSSTSSHIITIQIALYVTIHRDYQKHYSPVYPHTTGRLSGFQSTAHPEGFFTASALIIILLAP